MAITFQRVQPGDLITANLMNQIMAAIESLDLRISTGPPSTSTLAITQVSPSGTVHPGDKLQVLGFGFSSTPALNLVSIGGLAVTVEPGSSSTLLVVTVPALAGLPGDGSGVAANLTVSNANGSVTWPLTVAAADSLQVQMLVSNTGAPVDPKILANKTYTYKFTVTIFTSRNETFLFKPSADLGWTTVATPPSVLVPKTMSFMGTPVDVSVAVTVPMNTPDLTKAKLTLEAASSTNQSLKSSGSVDIVVGAAPTPAQGDFTAAFANAVDGAATIANDGVVELPKSGQIGEVDFQATFTSTAQGNSHYDVSASLDDPTGWTLTQTNPVGFNIGVVPGSFAPLAVQLKASNTAQSTNLNLKVSLTNDPTKFALASQKIRPK